jgi:hypothetical protein
MEVRTKKPASTKSIAITITHGLAGWALCGATMGVGMAVTTVRLALIIHAIAAPVVFAVVSFSTFVISISGLHCAPPPHFWAW